MANLDPPEPPAATNILDRLKSLPILRWLGRAAAGIVIVALVIGGLMWGRSGADPDTPIAEQWNAAISRLGFEAAYPPIEDIVVGDIFAVVSKDEISDVRGEAFAGRSLKLMHQPMTAELSTTYRQTYQFPATTPRPGDGAVWLQTESSGSVFSAPETRSAMPLVVFPNFTIEKKRSFNASGGGFARLWNAVLSAASSGNEVIDVKLGGMETYGVGAVPAEYDLLDFCNDKTSEIYCTDKGLRKQLSIIVGDKINDVVTDKTTGEKRHRFSVEIALVYRVFLARSIETRLREENAANADLHATPPKPGQGQANESTGPNAAAGFQHALSSNVIIPSTVFARPVVVGFRTVRWRGTGEVLP
jgi:hypothetical protein